MGTCFDNPMLSIEYPSPPSDGLWEGGGGRGGDREGVGGEGGGRFHLAPR